MQQIENCNEKTNTRTTGCEILRIGFYRVHWLTCRQRGERSALDVDLGHRIFKKLVSLANENTTSTVDSLLLSLHGL